MDAVHYSHDNGCDFRTFCWRALDTQTHVFNDREKVVINPRSLVKNERNLKRQQLNLGTLTLRLTSKPLQSFFWPFFMVAAIAWIAADSLCLCSSGESFDTERFTL